MRNGQGSREKLPSESEVASPSRLYDPVNHHNNGNENEMDDDVCCSSQYSSCGDSDFDKYCSANSAMGTPSVCGSAGSMFHDFNNDSDFKLGDQISNLTSFRVNRRLSNSNYRGSEFCDGEMRNNLGLGQGLVEASSTNEVDFVENNIWRGEEELGNEFNVGNDDGLQGLDLDDEGGEEVDKCSNETSSRYDHSEGDDSMFGNGTDDADRRVGVYHRTSIQHLEETCHENQLFMTSATAFGSDDFDDFMQETGANPLGCECELLGVMPTIGACNSSDLMPPSEVHGTKKELSTQNEVSAYLPPNAFPSIKLLVKHKDLINISAATNEISGLAECSSRDSTLRLNKFDEANQSKDVKGRGILFSNDNDPDIVDQAKASQTFSRSNLSKSEHDPLIEKAPLKGNNEHEKKQEHMRSEEATGMLNDIVVKSMDIKERKKESLLDPFSDFAENRLYLVSGEVTKNREAESVKDHDLNESSSWTRDNMNRTIQTSPILYNRFEDYFTPGKTDTSQLNEFFDEFVHDMEEVLLDSSESPGSRLTQNSRLYHPQTSIPSRDGGSTASTSGAVDAYPLIQHRLRIDGVEVVGAKQKKGDVSLSERLVGVKEYTVYVIRVWTGDGHWEVERRYRDFFTLYQHLKRAFVVQGWNLPSPWSSVEQESRKIFGSSSPGVIAERSVLIQQCLTSVLLPSRNLSASSNALISFLSPSKAIPISSASDMHIQKNSTNETNSCSSLGRTISFVVKIQPHKSVKQLLDAQHYTCGGCRKNFNDGKTRLQDLVQTFGWGKPRLCEYSGQLFCSLCHTNDYAVLPARVLHYWDFAKYPVSQLAKSYLDSIYDQPMVCVGAVNPHLFSKVPALQHVTNIRKRIRGMLPYVGCPFRTTIYKALGSRRYLVESSDFFALRDLVDLSKGVFAGLPVMMESVSKRIVEHITEQCLICCDVGIPCNARQACDDPSCLIFPFQEEGEIEKCKACSLAFHKNCFKKVVSCPCGVHFKATSLDMEGERGSLFSGLLSKVTRKLGGEENNNVVIRMASLPNTSL